VSRIGKNPIEIPAGVTVGYNGSIFTVKGPKGEMTHPVHKDVTVTVDGPIVTVTRSTNLKEHRSLHGTTRAVIANMVLGVTEGFKRDLELVGVGYKVEQIGASVLFSLGYSHAIAFIPPPGVTLTVATPTAMSVTGIDKQLVGQVAAKIRDLRPPEPYKGKGIKYAGEQIRRKAGKTAKA
jgi:large subunit ribosomal protein L6